MKPDAIPLLFCGALCILPALIGLGSFFLARSFSRMIPRLEKSHPEIDGRKVTRWELSLDKREHAQDRPVREDKDDE